MRRWGSFGAAVLLIVAAGCSRPAPTSVAPAAATARPSILLVTLDTTRADSVQPESHDVETPTLAALARRGTRFTAAYTTTPQTLPAHTSMMTGLYPAGHGLHDNARRLGASQPLLAEKLKAAGYATAAFVSGYPLDRQFGLARGFDLYDDQLGAGLAERKAGDTTERALAWLDASPQGPLFLWVHYYDPHEPYAPPPPYRERYVANPYLGEIAYMDHELGRLVEAFGKHSPDVRILVVGDHGEGLGEHGERYHGDLLYQGTVRVPLVVAGRGVPAAVRTDPVSTRHVFDTVLVWAGLGPARSLLEPAAEPVLGEAMRPYLQYGWQPQVMVVEGTTKIIRSGHTEIYDLASDPHEEHDLGAVATLDRTERQALSHYPIPSPDPTTDATASQLDVEARKKLASLGYVASGAPPPLRPDAPDPRQMTALLPDLEAGASLFVRGRYADVVPLYRKVLEADPHNLMVTLQLAVAESMLGREAAAMSAFRRAQAIAPDSVDVKHYLAMHEFQQGRFAAAEPLFVSVLAVEPGRLPALECLAKIRERENRLDEASALLERAVLLESSPVPTLLELGSVDMARGDTDGALRAFEGAHAAQGDAFAHFLDLGVLYLADSQLAAARDALDRVPRSSPDYPLALFKRAQVSVLLGEPDQADRVRQAYAAADDRTRPLIERETLFRGIPLR